MSVCDKRIIKINKYFLKEIINKNKYKVIDKYLIWPSVLKTQLRIALLKIKIYNKHYITLQVKKILNCLILIPVIDRSSKFKISYK